MSLLRAVRAKGHVSTLKPDMTIVLELAPGADAKVAEEWVRKNEQMLRLELITETQLMAGVCGVFSDAKVRKVRDAKGEEIRGLFEVRARG